MLTGEPVPVCPGLFRARSTDLEPDNQGVGYLSDPAQGGMEALDVPSGQSLFQWCLQCWAILGQKYRPLAEFCQGVSRWPEKDIIYC